MLILATDFGLAGPYMGQMHAVLALNAPSVPRIDLFADLPVFDPYRASYLLPAYCRTPFPADSVFLCVVDPGVGTDRKAVIVRTAQGWFVGPDNGLFAQIVRRAKTVEAWEILWRPETLSASFHGRDLFAPVAAALARGERPAAELTAGCLYVAPLPPTGLDRPQWPDDLAEIVYLDHYGNAITGLRPAAVASDAVLSCRGHRVRAATTFGDVPPQSGFWYVNSNGLIEIALHGGSVATHWHGGIGDHVSV